MKSEISLLEEHLLEFGDGNELTDPHAGLSLFGPYDKNESGRPREISYALVGASSGIAAFKKFVKILNRPLLHEQLQGANPNMEVERVWPPFPGFGAAFDCELPDATRFEYAILDADIEAIKARYREYYADNGLVRFVEDPAAEEGGFLSSAAMSGRDDLVVSVYGNAERAILVARFDNLGKGASGAAIQNMNIVLGCAETEGLKQ